MNDDPGLFLGTLFFGFIYLSLILLLIDWILSLIGLTIGVL